MKYSDPAVFKKKYNNRLKKKLPIFRVKENVQLGDNIPPKNPYNCSVL